MSGFRVERVPALALSMLIVFCIYGCGGSGTAGQVADADTQRTDTAEVESDSTTESDTVVDSKVDSHSEADSSELDTQPDTSSDVRDTFVSPPRPDGPHCSTAADCAEATPICDPLYRVCVACIAGNDCDRDHYCSSYECVPKPGPGCYTQADCNPDGFRPLKTTTPYCKPHDLYCVACLADWQCGTGQRCKNNVCSDGEIACESQGDCPGALVCEKPRYASHTWCVECWDDFDCPIDTVCDRHELSCVPAPTRVQWSPPSAASCSSDNDCRALGLRCDTAAGRCAQCGPNLECPSGYLCESGNCVAVEECRPGQQRCTRPCRDLDRCDVVEGRRPVGAVQTCGADGLWDTGPVELCAPLVWTDVYQITSEVPNDCTETGLWKAQCGRPACNQRVGSAFYDCVSPEEVVLCRSDINRYVNARCTCDETKWSTGCKP